MTQPSADNLARAGVITTDKTLTSYLPQDKVKLIQRWLDLKIAHAIDEAVTAERKRTETAELRVVEAEGACARDHSLVVVK